jgi:hypothetical protein
VQCVTQSKTIGWLWTQRRRINLDPPYQREAGVWSPEKKQLFVDSLLNRYDVPKIYYHDLSAKDDQFLFAVIDGKQRLSAIWEFLEGKFPLASDFTFTGDTSYFEGRPTPKAGDAYDLWEEDQREYFRSAEMDVVLVQNADEDDIEDLFSRLNNGEPLNAAEKRNAKGGAMAKLIREVAELPFFVENLGFANRRYSYLEVAAKLVRLEMCAADGAGVFCDLKKKFLDELVNKQKDVPLAEARGILARVEKGTKRLRKVFAKKDPLLGKQSFPQLYYGWVKTVEKDYAHEHLYSVMQSFLQDFTKMRLENLSKPEDERDATLVEYGRLTQQGTNDLKSMQERARILTRYLLASHPEIVLKDPKRDFTDDERYVIWISAGKKCTNEVCAKELPQLEDMHADHIKAWAKGGPTSLENAQALCSVCNQAWGSKSKAL